MVGTKLEVPSATHGEFVLWANTGESITEEAIMVSQLCCTVYELCSTKVFRTAMSQEPLVNKLHLAFKLAWRAFVTDQHYSSLPTSPAK